MTWLSKQRKHISHSRDRTIALPGKGLDTGVWYKCNRCGFPIDSRRTQYGGGGTGVIVTDQIIGGVTYKSAQVTRGCPLCGKLTWK